MCGIVYAKSFEKKPVNKIIQERYEAQKNRGTEGFGFFSPELNRLTHNARERRILQLLKRNKASEILFHHRFPTSTDNVRNACHPFSTKNYFKHNYVLVHNGIVGNDDDLKMAHEKLGINYISEQPQTFQFNDSEALLWDVALYLQGEQKTLKARGSIAFICIESDENHVPIKLHFGRNWGSPLKMNFTDKLLTLASEGEGEPVITNKLYTYDYSDNTLVTQQLEIPETVYAYPYYGVNSWEGGKQPIGFQAPGYTPNYASGHLSGTGRSRSITELAEADYYDSLNAGKDLDDELDGSNWYWDAIKESLVNMVTGEVLNTEPVGKLDTYEHAIAKAAMDLGRSLVDEFGNVEDAMFEAQAMLDSILGKLTRCAKVITAVGVSNKKLTKYSQERDTLRKREDVLDNCIELLQGMWASDVAYTRNQRETI